MIPALTSDELNSLNALTWKPQGMGSYNVVRRSATSLTLGGYTGLWVFKNVKESTEVSEPARAVRKWNEQNPGFPAWEFADGWIAPFVGNQPATDKQIACKLIDIYLRTRNIILDGCGLNNFLVYDNQVICVDMDLAYRRGSFASDDFLDSHNPFEFDVYWATCASQGMPWSVAVTKTMLYLEKHLTADEIKDAYITPNLFVIIDLFRKKKEPITADRLDFIVKTISEKAQAEKLEYRTPEFFNQLYGYYHNRITDEHIHDQLLDLAWVRALTADEFKALVYLGIEGRESCIDQRGADGYTLLHIAVMHQHTESVRYLLEKKADVNMNVFKARKPNDSNTAYTQMTALEMAASLYNNNEILVLLLNAAARLPSRDYLLSNQHETPQRLREKIESHPLEHPIAAHRKDLLMRAQHPAQRNIMPDLSALGDNAAYFTWQLDEKGDTFIHHAFYHNNQSVITWLIQHPQWETLSRINNQKTGDTLMHCISRTGQLDLYQYLPALDINVKNHKGETALLVASRYKHAACCRFLLEHGANPTYADQWDVIPELYWPEKVNPFTLMKGHLSNIALGRSKVKVGEQKQWEDLICRDTHLLTWILDKKTGNTFLHLIFTANNRDLIQRLSEHEQWSELRHIKNQLTGETLLHKAADAGHLELCAYLDGVDIHAQATENKETALMRAAKNGHRDFCEQLIQLGAEVDHRTIYGSTALMLAADGGHAAVCELLLAKNANLHLVDRGNNHALNYAARKGDMACCELFIRKKLNCNHRNTHHKTALLYAARGGHEDLCLFLIQSGAYCDVKDHEANTVLLYAADNGMESVCAGLLKNGAKINHQNRYGNTALMLASSKQHQAVCELLLNHGADTLLINQAGERAEAYWTSITCNPFESFKQRYVRALAFEEEVDKEVDKEEGYEFVTKAVDQPEAPLTGETPLIPQNSGPGPSSFFYSKGVVHNRSGFRPKPY